MTMNNTMSYHGYTARVEYDPRDNIFVGHVIGLFESISFHGETVADLVEGFHLAIQHYLDDCTAAGRKPQKPYSGKIMLRVPPEIHAYVATMAEAHGKSLNQWALEVLAEAK